MDGEDNETTDQGPKRSRARWFVIGLWCIVCGWLVVSLIVGLVGSLFYGNGPVLSDSATPTDYASDQVSIHSDRSE